MATIASLIIDVAANTAKLQTDVSKIHGQLDGVGASASKLGTMLAGAFTIGAITSAATQVLRYASNISDLSAQTGLTTQSIQEMSHAAKMTGASLENFTNAAFKLGVNIAGGGNSVVGSVEKLGLSYMQLKAMSPDQQFNTIATALQGVQNEQERNKIAVDLFGKAAKDILPAIAQGYADIASQAVISGDAQIQALDAAGDAIDRLKEQVMGLGVVILGSFAQSMEHLGVALKQDFELIKTHTFDRLTTAVSDWGTIFGRAAQAPKAMGVALKDLPAPISAVTMSLEEQRRIEKGLTEQGLASIEANKKRIESERNRVREVENQNAKYRQFMNSIGVAEIERVAEQQRNLDKMSADYRKYMNDIGVAEIERVAAHQQHLAQQQADLRAYYNWLGERRMEEDAKLLAQQQVWRKTFSDTFTALPGVIMAAIQGGGSVIGAAGAHIGTSLMSQFQRTFGPAIEAALPFGIGKAITALLPSLGALFGPIAEKIGGFFRSIFGGPSADEIRGRQAVAEFEAQLHSTLNATQRLEAGNQAWKMTVIAIRDAYIAAGLSEADALLAAERLWASSRNGGVAAQAVIDEIKRLMEGAAGAAGQFGASLDSATRPRTINIGFNVEDMPDLGNIGPGFASGSGGIRDFGRGTPVILHGRERVQTESQMRSEQSGGGRELLDAVNALRRELPNALLQAVKVGMALA